MKTMTLFRSLAWTAALLAAQSLFAVPPASSAPASRDGVIVLPDSPPIVMPPYFVRPGVPAVTRLMEPRISTTYVGQRLELRFIVNADGYPEAIGAVNVGSDLNLVTQLAAAIKGWEFEPARDRDGIPHECEVILPVEIGPSNGTGAAERAPNDPVRLPVYYVRVNHDEPAPLHYVIPRLGPRYAGQSVTLRFVVDRTGRPYNIAAVGEADPNFVTQLSAAIGYWQFDPARDAAGHPIERVMLLPVAIE